MQKHLNLRNTNYNPLRPQKWYPRSQRAASYSLHHQQAEQEIYLYPTFLPNGDPKRLTSFLPPFYPHKDKIRLWDRCESINEIMTGSRSLSKLLWDMKIFLIIVRHSCLLYHTGLQHHPGTGHSEICSLDQPSSSMWLGEPIRGSQNWCFSTDLVGLNPCLPFNDLFLPYVDLEPVRAVDLTLPAYLLSPALENSCLLCRRWPLSSLQPNCLALSMLPVQWVWFIQMRSQLTQAGCESWNTMLNYLHFKMFQKSNG